MSGATLAILPILVKMSFTGFTTFEWSRTEKCEIFENQVIITKTYKSTSIEYKVPFMTTELSALVKKALEEEISEEGNLLCDGPSTVVMANYQNREIPLYSTGGCGAKRRTRQGPHSMALLDIANTFCPTTH